MSLGEPTDDVWLEFGDNGGDGDNWAEGEDNGESDDELEFSVPDVVNHLVDDTMSEAVVRNA